MTTKRVKVEYVDRPDVDPYYFETLDEAQNWVKFLQSLPLTDHQGNDIPPAKFRITEYAATNSKVY